VGGWVGGVANWELGAYVQELPCPPL
jgi:hypothetical protein